MNTRNIFDQFKTSDGGFILKDHSNPIFVDPSSTDKEKQEAKEHNKELFIDMFGEDQRIIK